MIQIAYNPECFGPPAYQAEVVLWSAEMLEPGGPIAEFKNLILISAETMALLGAPIYLGEFRIPESAEEARRYLKGLDEMALRFCDDMIQRGLLSDRRSERE